MANWSPLRERLREVDSLTLSWDELNELVGGLPPSASRHSAFWSGHRVAWTGFHTRHVRLGESVTFVRDSGVGAVAGAGHAVALQTAVADPQHAEAEALPGRPDVVLIGCVKGKLEHPAPAKDLYLSSLFDKERAYAEASGAPWFILSAKYGLVGPEDVIAPYELALADTPSQYRRAWGQGVVQRLAAVAGPLPGKTIEIHAGTTYTNPIRGLLHEAGATAVEPLAGLPLGSRLAWYNTATVAHHGPAAVSGYIAALRDESAALTVDQFLATGSDGFNSPGLYSWWVDPDGAADLTRGLGHVVQPGLVYAGLAGATHGLSGKPSTNTLRGRIGGMHLGNNHRFSTLRLSLGSVLAETYGWEGIDETSLSRWMHAHLRVIAIPVADATTLGSVETAVLAELDPPLNLTKVPPTELRHGLSALRKYHGRKVRPPGQQETVADDAPAPPDSADCDARAQLRLAQIPSADGDLLEILEFALTYNGYERLGRGPEYVQPLVEPVLAELSAHDQVPDWAGLDLLRAALFFFQRQTHHWGYEPPETVRQMRILVRAITDKARGQVLIKDDF